MPNQKLKTVILGCGGRGKEHVPAILADDRLELVAVCDLNREAGEAMVSEFNLTAEVFTDPEQLLAQIKPQVVVIALWTDLHLPVLRRCIAHGARVVLSEKPMAKTFSDCQEISRIATEAGITLTFCHQRRFSSKNLAVRKALQSGVFGKIERMELFSPPHLLDCGVHTVDQAFSYNDESPVDWVHGAVDLSETVNYFGVVAEGMTSAFFHFKNGVHATLRTGGKDMSMWGGVRVIGSNGFIEAFWDGDLGRVVVYDQPDFRFPEVTVAEGEAMAGMVKNAIDAYEGGFEPELSHQRALRASEVLFAIYESARKHERVDLPLTGTIGSPLLDILEKK